MILFFSSKPKLTSAIMIASTFKNLNITGMLFLILIIGKSKIRLL